MIVSDGHRFVFAHVPKTGGIAVRAALMPFADAQDCVSPATTHETLPDLLARAPRLAGHYKFAFTRNPWDRLVSFFAHARRFLGRSVPELQRLDFAGMLRAIDRGVPWASRLHALRPQCEHVRGADFVGCFERLGDDFAFVCARLGLAATLERRNASRHGAYAAQYDSWGRDFVAARYALDIAEFGYAFEAQP